MGVDEILDHCFVEGPGVLCNLYILRHTVNMNVQMMIEIMDKRAIYPGTRIIGYRSL
jgi:hypothetical protein